MWSSRGSPSSGHFPVGQVLSFLVPLVCVGCTWMVGIKPLGSRGVGGWPGLLQPLVLYTEPHGLRAWHSRRPDAGLLALPACGVYSGTGLTGVSSAPPCTGRASFHRAEKLPMLMAWPPATGAACCKPGCHSPSPFLPWLSSLSTVTVSLIVLCFWSISRILKHIIFVQFLRFLNCLLNMTALGSMAVSWKSWVCFFFFFCLFSFSIQKIKCYIKVR